MRTHIKYEDTYIASFANLIFCCYCCIQALTGACMTDIAAATAALAADAGACAPDAGTTT
jgi:hypothetical protein